MANVAGGYILMNSNSQMSSFIMLNYYLIEGREEGITEYQPGHTQQQRRESWCVLLYNFLIEKMIVDYFEGYGSSKCVLTTVRTT